MAMNTKMYYDYIVLLPLSGQAMRILTYFINNHGINDRFHRYDISKIKSHTNMSTPAVIKQINTLKEFGLMEIQYVPAKGRTKVVKNVKLVNFTKDELIKLIKENRFS